MSESECCSTNEQTTFCVVEASGQRCSCAESQPVSAPLVVVQPKKQDQDLLSSGHQEFWKNVRSGLLFALACVTSPCCTPVLVPIVLALLAGTPLALWLTQYVGWVYGGLMVVCVVSLVFAVRSLFGQKRNWFGLLSDEAGKREKRGGKHAVS